MTPAADNKGTAAPDGTPNLQADIDSLLGKIDTTANRVEAAAAPAAALSSDVKSLLDQPAPALPSTEALQALDNLDAQLAELTAELLEPNKPVAPVAEPEQHAAAAVVPAAPLAPAAPPVAVKPPSAPVVPPAAAAVANPASTASAPAGSQPSMAAIVEEPSTTGPLFRFFERLSSPLASRPRPFRVATGLLAVNTLLLAGGVWAYLLLREPPAPTRGPAFNLATDTLPRPVEPSSEQPKDKKADPKKSGDKAKPAGGGH
ncbi:MAG TPA: hypothetical protein VD997_17590 [Phycisphaerales bacterium]|nr:hypothetical protein [Phycisphaerales bacterium]